jgi:hypothetical protein
MGCDIHLFIEVQKEDKWEIYDWLEEVYLRDENYKIITDEEDNEPLYDYKKLLNHPLYVSRNYNLFAILANVRNWDDAIVPISKPRGIPDDISEYVKKERDKVGYHSPSYFLVQELLDYNWSKIIKRSGFVSKYEFENISQYGKPFVWFSELPCENHSVISKEAMNEIVENNIKDDVWHLTWVEWEDKYSDLCKQFVEKTLPNLSKLGNPNSVRLVFWFDN